jgi:urocanate hydratase
MKSSRHSTRRSTAPSPRPPRSGARSIGVHCNAVELLERLIEREHHPRRPHRPDQRPRPPRRLRPRRVLLLTRPTRPASASTPPTTPTSPSPAWNAMSARWSTLQRRGSEGLRLRQQHPPARPKTGLRRRLRFPGFVPAFIRPQFCLGRGPFRWVALSGDPERDIYVTDHELSSSSLKDRAAVQPRASAAGSSAATPTPRPCSQGDFDECVPRFGFQGLPARICWLGLGERDKAGLLFNELVAAARSAPPSSSAATTSTAAASPAPTARPRP